MAKLVLDMDAMQDDFFGDAAMIGIVSAQPGYRFCWMLNRHFDIDFKNYPEQNISLKRKENTFHFPTYQYDIDNCEHKYLLYKLKNGSETLIQETKQLDYLLLIQTADPDHDAHILLKELRNIPDVQLAQMLEADQIKKSLSNLLV
jgi:hypothetical protein